jgi:hypothetical protein
MSIITSGHLKEDQITSQVRGASQFRITESNIIKILMRGEYRYFSDQSGFASNIFSLETEWKKPSNFLLGEILFYLARNRYRIGQVGIEGYFSVRHVSDELQLFGFDPEDVVHGCNILLTRYLVNADHMNNIAVDQDDSIKISASGYIHLRVLAEQIEYLYNILPTTRIDDEETVDIIVDIVKRENTMLDVSLSAKVHAVRKFFNYLQRQAISLAKQSGRTYAATNTSSGSSYLLRQIVNAIRPDLNT